MMITNLGFLTRILMVFHIKLTNQRLCNGLFFSEFFVGTRFRESEKMEGLVVVCWLQRRRGIDFSATPVNAYHFLNRSMTNNSFLRCLNTKLITTLTREGFFENVLIYPWNF